MTGYEIGEQGELGTLHQVNLEAHDFPPRHTEDPAALAWFAATLAALANKQTDDFIPWRQTELADWAAV